MKMPKDFFSKRLWITFLRITPLLKKKTAILCAINIISPIICLNYYHQEEEVREVSVLALGKKTVLNICFVISNVFRQGMYFPAES